MFPTKDNIVTLNPESILAIETFLVDATQQEFENTNLCEEIETFWLRMRVPSSITITDDMLADWRNKLSIMLQSIPVPFIVTSLIIDDEICDDVSLIQLRGLITFSGLNPYYGA